MTRHRHPLQQLLDATHALVWFPIPRQRRRITVEFWEVIDAGRGIVGGVVQAGELVCGSSCYFDAVVILDWILVNGGGRREWRTRFW
jgi:hypothetical protein